jgi:GNAT superfamily N-acetyltransferase
MNLRVEDALASDIEAIADLLHALFTQEAEFTPDRDRQLRALRMFMADPSDGHLFVARENGAIIGMASLQFEISTALGGRAAWVEDVIVNSAHRGRGVGKRLFEHLIAFAHSEGLLRLSLLTDHDNHTAQGFYARFGFARSPMLPMRLILDPAKTKP